MNLIHCQMIQALLKYVLTRRIGFVSAKNCYKLHRSCLTYMEYLQAVYGVLREAEARSTALIPYWNIPILKDLSPRQRKVSASLKLINDVLNDLINICKVLFLLCLR